MPSTTWTRAALSSSARPLSGVCWRVVEAQHHVSTLKLVDTLDEQQLLEALIEDTKPPVPPECRHLHYRQCQALSETARIASIEVIRYQSVRDPQRGMNLALLTCRVFAKPEPVSLQTWRIHLRASGAQAICEAPKTGTAFDRKTFAADPRIAALRWNR